MNNTSQVKNVLSGIMAGCKSPELFWESIAELQGSPPEAAKPKEKRAPSAYVLFSSRVGALIHGVQAEMPKEQKTKQTVIMQFTSPLWEQSKSGKVWEDQEILEAWRTFVPPEHSKQSLAKAAEAAGSQSVPKMQVANSDLAQTESSGDSATESAKKPRKPQSEETKAAAALKRAATKAAKAASASTGAALPVVAGLQGGWAEAEVMEEAE
jgi:hypothetical protein